MTTVNAKGRSRDRQGGVDIYIDETGCDENTEVRAVAAVTTWQPEALRAKLRHAHEAVIDDYFLSLENATARGRCRFHFAADTQSVREPVIRSLCSMPLEGYVVMARTPDVDEKVGSGWYWAFLEEILKRRLVRFLDAPVRIIVESPPKGGENQVRDAAASARRRAEVQGGRAMAFTPEVLVRGKQDELCLIAPDYLAGVVREYSSEEKAGRETTRMNYRRLRPRIREIYDYVARKSYGRSTEEFRGYETLFPRQG